MYRAYDWISGPAAFGSVAWSQLESSVGAGLISPLAFSFMGGIIYACWTPFLLCLAGVPLRKRWLAICVTAVIFTVVFSSAGSPRPLLAAAFYLPVFIGFLGLTLSRYGLIGLFGAALIYALTLYMPLTLDTSAWYFNTSLAEWSFWQPLATGASELP